MIKEYEVLIKNYFEDYERKEVIKIDSSKFEDKEDEYDTIYIVALLICEEQEHVVDIKLIE